MKTVMMIVHSLISVALIYMVLNQMSKFAELGGAFGSGGLHTMFGRKKGLDTSGKITLGLSIAFFVSSILTAFFISR
ncbi:preprotein translocase subunit SecG [Pseudothermotoga sp. U03pept]|uniref:preprotein translocase subunit SecG n=1 Tax=Pseudothermotoga sp. U03pept TaxID=3447012 RepID=UPI003EFD0251